VKKLFDIIVRTKCDEESSKHLAASADQRRQHMKSLGCSKDVSMNELPAYRILGMPSFLLKG